MPVTLDPYRKPRPVGAVSLAEDISLPLLRAHEACGPARHVFALALAGRMEGPVIWLSPSYTPERLMPDGVVHWMQPGRLTFAAAHRPLDLLWGVEEVLRSGAVPLVVAELPEPPPLTPVRRMHLAAEEGAKHGVKPLALLLTPGDGGAQGVESRWKLSPRPGWVTPGKRPAWLLERLRARLDPPRSWRMEKVKGGVRFQGEKLAEEA